MEYRTILFPCDTPWLFSAFPSAFCEKLGQYTLSHGTCQLKFHTDLKKYRCQYLITWAADSAKQVATHFYFRFQELAHDILTQGNNIRFTNQPDIPPHNIKTLKGDDKGPSSVGECRASSDDIPEEAPGSSNHHMRSVKA